MVERRIRNAQVQGSIPCSGSTGECRSEPLCRLRSESGGSSDPAAIPQEKTGVRGCTCCSADGRDVVSGRRDSSVSTANLSPRPIGRPRCGGNRDGSVRTLPRVTRSELTGVGLVTGRLSLSPRQTPAAMRALSAALATDAIPGGGLVAAALFTAATAVFIAAAFAFGLLPKCAGGVQPARRSSQ